MRSAWSMAGRFFTHRFDKTCNLADTASDCYCAPGLLLGLLADPVGTCRVACQDAHNIACGGLNSPIIYTTSVGGIFPDLAVRLALPFPEYECRPKSKYLICPLFTSSCL